MRKIKIGISGSHSTGKTTFIKRLEKALIEKSIKFKTVSDLATICPLPILRNHTVESTLWIASKGITDEVETEYKFDVVIADRPILDSWAYFNAVCKNQYEESNPKLQTLKSMILHWLPTYDIIYQTVINENIPIEDNKGRDLDIEYRKEIGTEMIEASKQFNITPKLLTYENTDNELEFILTLIGKTINKI
jgi:tRNA uridine 5-carbamoylmethylation protein Kti12